VIQGVKDIFSVYSNTKGRFEGEDQKGGKREKEKRGNGKTKKEINDAKESCEDFLTYPSIVYILVCPLSLFAVSRSLRNRQIEWEHRGEERREKKNDRGNGEIRSETNFLRNRHVE